MPPIGQIKVAELFLPSEKREVILSLKPNRHFSRGEVEDLKITIAPCPGYQYIVSFGFNWHLVGEQSLRKLEVRYLQIGHKGSHDVESGFVAPPSARDSFKPSMGNPNLDEPIILNSPVWRE